MTVKDADTLKSYFNLTKVPVPSNYVDLIDTIFDQGSGGGGGEHDHDDRYVQLVMPNSILAIHTFNPSIYSAPFILGAKAQGQLVIGLNADKLDGLESSSNPGSNQRILASDTQGRLTIEGLFFGSAQDVDLFRPSANQLKTDDNFWVDGNFTTPSNIYLYNATSKIYFSDGAGSNDVVLYRLSAHKLKTDDAFIAGDNITTSGHYYLYEATKAVYFGDGAGNYDTNLYRAAANQLKTDDDFIVAGDIHTNYLTSYTALSSITIKPAGDIILNPDGNDVNPETNYLTNLGTINKKYLTLHAAELWVDTLVAHETIATIGGRIIVAPTTSLLQDVSGTLTNTILNPDFTILGGGGADVFANWTESVGSGTIVADGTIFHGERYSCRLTGSIGNNTYIAGDLGVSTPGYGLIITFWSRGNGTTAGRWAIYDNAHGNYLVDITSTGNVTTTWYQYQAEVVLPSGWTGGSLRFYCPGTGTGSAWFDDVFVYYSYFLVKHNNMGWHDILYLEARGKVEFVRVISGPYAETEGYSVFVMRNLDDTGVDDWIAGDAVVNTGYPGDGFIDIYSEHAMMGPTEYGPTVVGNIRNSENYYDVVEAWAIGNLNGLYNYGVDTFGVAFGRHSRSSSFITIDNTQGIRIQWRNESDQDLTIGQWNMSGVITIGDRDSGNANIQINSTAMYFNENSSTTLMSLTTAGVVTVGATATEHITIDATSLKFYNGASVYAELNGSTFTMGPTATEHITIDASSMKFYNGASLYGQLSSSTWTLGLTTGPNTVISSTGIQLKNSSTTRIELTSTGYLYIRDSAGAAVITLDSSSGAAITKKLTMSGADAAISIGASPPFNSNTGTGIWIDQIGMYILNTSVQNLLISAVDGALYAGPFDIDQYPVTINGNGLLFKQDGIGSETASHIRFGKPSSIKGEIYFYYSGAGVFNQMVINACAGSNTGYLYLIGSEVIVEGQGVSSGVTISAGSGGTKIGTGLMVGDDMTAPPAASLGIANSSANPSYYSAGSMLYSRLGNLMNINGDNRKFNLVGGGGAIALLAPLVFPQPRALWQLNGSADVDLTYHHTTLSVTNMASWYKSDTPAPLYCSDFNGTNAVQSASLATYTHLNYTDWFCVGMWVYIDGTARSHGLCRMGTTTQAWYFLYYQPGAYIEFGYWDTGGTQRQMQKSITLTTGWHFFGFEFGWQASGNNTQTIRYDSSATTLQNQAWLGMRSGAGDFQLGCSLNGSYWLDGKMATYWITGWQPASVGDSLREYYNLTKGLFQT